jgi:glutathione peroxidase
MDLSAFKGKKVLFVNVASECGFTPQYNELQHLYDNHKDKLTVVGVPCNQFGGQEPGDAQQIATFCERNFGVTFPLTEKIEVKGSNQHALYQWLTKSELNGKEDSSVEWNFQKYLIDENGALLKVFAPGVNPLDDSLVAML